MAESSGAAKGDKDGPETERTIPVRLTTRTVRHEIPDTKYMVPSSWRRYQLSELINKVLEYELPVPFDFLVDGQLLRTSLSAYVESKGLSDETILQLEYVESILPPQYVSAFEHNDWVSDVDLKKKDLFLTASYDGTVTAFTTSGVRMTIPAGHSLPVLSACWIGTSDIDGEEASLIASGGMDRVIRISRFRTVPQVQGDDLPSSTPPAFLLPLHRLPVASVRSSRLPAATPRLLSSGWDGLVALWSLDASHTGGEEMGATQTRPAKRRRKANKDGEEVPRLSPVHVLQGHTGQVRRAIFDRNDAAKGYSCGWDHTLRTWDLEIGGQSSSKTAADKVLLDVDQMTSANLLVTGAMDRTVCFWDTRQETSTISLSLQGHSAPVAAVRAHPHSAVLAMSAGYDSMIRIWDARSPKQALFALKRRQIKPSDPDLLDNKILCIDWDLSGTLMAAGGEDGRIELHRSTARVPAEVQ